MHSFPNLNQSIVMCLVPTVTSWPAYRFLRRQVGWSGVPISWRIFHSLLRSTWSKGFSIVNEADVFLCLFYGSTNVGNLISGSLVFPKSHLYIWKFLVHILLKPVLKDFRNNIATMWNEHNCVVVWTFFGLVLLWNWNEKIGNEKSPGKIGLFQSCGHCWFFQICWHTECSTLTALSLRIWNSSSGLPLPPFMNELYSW